MKEVNLYELFKIVEHEFYQGTGYEVQENILGKYVPKGMFNSRDEAIEFIKKRIDERGI